MFNRPHMPTLRRRLLALIWLFALSSVLPLASQGAARIWIGMASYYGERFAGRTTASGERFDPSAMTAASKTLPLGSRVKVTNLDNDRDVVVRINDRGPYAKERIIDLSQAAAQKLGMIGDGTAPVRVRVLKR